MTFVLVLAHGSPPALYWQSVGIDAGLEGAGANVHGFDLRLSSSGSGDIDLQLANGDLVMDPGLATATIVSLWTDRRATLDDGIGIDDDPRGFWADREGDRWGSLLWLLERSKATEETLREAEHAAREACQWMRRAGIAQRITAAASWVERGHLRIELSIERDTRPRWAELWAGTAADAGRNPGARSSRLLLG